MQTYAFAALMMASSKTIIQLLPIWFNLCESSIYGITALPVIGQQTYTIHTLSQSDVEPKPIANWFPVFSRPLALLHVMLLLWVLVGSF